MRQPLSCVVVIACSSGGLQALVSMLSRLPADLPATLLIVSHTPPTGHRQLALLLSKMGPLPASYPEEGQLLEVGRIFIAPPDRHLVIQDNTLRLTSDKREHGLRPAADVLFRSAARTCGARTIGVVLSGGGQDGAAGLADIQAAGGFILVQKPSDAKLAVMPRSALAQVTPDACAPAAALGPLVARFARQCTRGAPHEETRGRPRPGSRSLKGLRVLVAEDDYLLALELDSMLGELGCTTVGPVASVRGGMRLVETEWERIDCAVLDIDLRGELVLLLAAVLTHRAVPFIFATGYGESVLPEAWTGAPQLRKPYDARALGAALRRALHQHWFPSADAPVTTAHLDYKQEALKEARNLLMRSHALQVSSSPKVLAKSHESIRSTRERIIQSKRREQVSRKTLGIRRPPGSGGPQGQDP